MSKLNKIKTYVSKLIKKTADEDERLDAAVHLYGVSSICALLASKRGLDVETSQIIGLLHDIYRYATGFERFHSHNGAEMARVVLNRVKGFTDNEKTIILSAIFHHSDKSHVHGPYDELLKDADILSPFFNGDRVMSIIRAFRIKNLADEMDLRIDYNSIEINKKQKKNNSLQYKDKRKKLADLSENLAGKQITGERWDDDYMKIIRYWPEDEAFDELKNGWCAAFVYYCCQKAGFYMPIRLPNSPCRLAGVAAWNEWAKDKKNNFFIKNEEGTMPSRGDIVLYNNIIPPENKPAEHRDIPIDHIGIVLGCDGLNFSAAEGNINNQNRSGILIRPLNKNVEGFIRISNQYEYDGWKINYKTGKEYIVPLDIESL